MKNQEFVNLILNKMMMQIPDKLTIMELSGKFAK